MAARAPAEPLGPQAACSQPGAQRRDSATLALRGHHRTPARLQGCPWPRGPLPDHKPPPGESSLSGSCLTHPEPSRRVARGLEVPRPGCRLSPLPRAGTACSGPSSSAPREIRGAWPRLQRLGLAAAPSAGSVTCTLASASAGWWPSSGLTSAMSQVTQAQSLSAPCTALQACS